MDIFHTLALTVSADFEIGDNHGLAFLGQGDGVPQVIPVPVGYQYEFGRFLLFGRFGHRIPGYKGIDQQPMIAAFYRETGMSYKRNFNHISSRF
jgi:hypothetical protein